VIEAVDMYLPCHAFFQFYVADGKLSCQISQQSKDIFLGVPAPSEMTFIEHYANIIVTEKMQMLVGDFIAIDGDCHLYSNHLEQRGVQSNRRLVGRKRRSDGV